MYVYYLLEYKGLYGVYVYLMDVADFANYMAIDKLCGIENLLFKLKYKSFAIKHKTYKLSLSMQ